MRQRCLKEHHSVFYNAMILDGTLWNHLFEVDKTCKERMDVLILGTKEKQGIKEVFRERYRIWDGMPLTELEWIINPVCDLCRDHEQSGF